MIWGYHYFRKHPYILKSHSRIQPTYYPWSMVDLHPDYRGNGPTHRKINMFIRTKHLHDFVFHVNLPGFFYSTSTTWTSVTTSIWNHGEIRKYLLKILENLHLEFTKTCALCKRKFVKIKGIDLTVFQKKLEKVGVPTPKVYASKLGWKKSLSPVSKTHTHILDIF